MILRATGSRSGAIAACALLLLNPNVLYLQSTPMTEPLLFATTAAALALIGSWIERGGSDDGRTPPALALAAACLTRYEAWPITAAAIVLAVRGAAATREHRSAQAFAAMPAARSLARARGRPLPVNSRWTVGAWFVSGGFFVAENTDALGHPLVAWKQVREGLTGCRAPALRVVRVCGRRR